MNNKNNFLPFALPDIGEDEINEVVSCLRSGWLTTGPKTKQFELEFSEYLGGGVEAIAVNSATAGLHLALEALGVGPGDQVIVPTLTFTATAEVARYLGAELVFVDCNPATLTIDVKAVEKAITNRTKVIVPVHYAGLACEMNELLLLAKKYDLRVVEDAAHALPTVYKGNLIGTLESDVTVFSFYANKTITTGEGGMVVTKNPEVANRIKMMRIHGISRDVFDRFSSKKPSWYYEVVAPGYKYNLTDIASAIGIHQLRKLGSFLKRRQELAARYFSELVDLPIALPVNAPYGSSHAWHLFVIQLKDNCIVTRNVLIERLADLGIGTSVHYIPLHNQPYWRDTYNLSANDFPNAENAYQRMLSLPLYTKMSDSDQDKVINSLKQLLI